MGSIWFPYVWGCGGTGGERPETTKSATNIETDTLAPVHPGEVLTEEFLTPHGLSARALALRIGVPPNRISEIAAGRRAVTGDTAQRLAAAFGTTAEFRMNLQKDWELAVARGEERPEIEPVGRG